MKTANRRTAEKGQRTPHAIDAYGEKGGVKGDAYCPCGLLFRNKRWLREENDTGRHDGHKHACPACRRTADRNPAGIVSLSGEYFAVHETDVLNQVVSTTLESIAKNPLGRVMGLVREQDSVTITTTDVKLAQKIGRDVLRSQGGELHFTWSHAGDPVRVTWFR